jgi:hypothetical protein
MNPMSRQHPIREFELFVSEGVHEVPESVFERDSRSSGEMRVVREDTDNATAPSRPASRTVIGTIKIDRATGEVVDD